MVKGPTFFAVLTALRFRGDRFGGLGDSGGGGSLSSGAGNTVWSMPGAFSGGKPGYQNIDDDLEEAAPAPSTAPPRQPPPVSAAPGPASHSHQAQSSKAAGQDFQVTRVILGSATYVIGAAEVTVVTTIQQTLYLHLPHVFLLHDTLRAEPTIKLLKLTPCRAHPPMTLSESGDVEGKHSSPPTTVSLRSQHLWSVATLSPDWSFVEAGEAMFPWQGVPATTAMPLPHLPGPSSGHDVDTEGEPGNTDDVPATTSDSSFPGALPYSMAIFSQAPSTSDALKLPFSPDSRSRGWAGPTMSSRLLSPNPQSPIQSHAQPVHSAASSAPPSNITPLRASLLASRLKPQTGPSLSGSEGSSTSKHKPSLLEAPSPVSAPPYGATGSRSTSHSVGRLGQSVLDIGARAGGVAGVVSSTSSTLPRPSSSAAQPSVLPVINPFASSLARDALMTYAYRLYHQHRQTPPHPVHAPTESFSAASEESPLTVHTDTEALAHPYTTQLIPLLGNLEKLHPRCIPIKLLLGCAKYAVGDFVASIAVNEEILRFQPDFVESMSNIGTAVLAQGDRETAEKWWRKAIDLRPTYWDASDNLVGSLCHVDADRFGDSSRTSGSAGAIGVCDYVRSKTTVLDSSTGTHFPLSSVLPHHVHRLQGLLYTSANLRLHKTESHSVKEIQEVVQGYRSAVDVVFSPIRSVDHGTMARSASHFFERYSCEDIVVATTVVGLMSGNPSTATIRDIAMALGVLQWPGLNTKVLQAEVEVLALVKIGREKILPVLLRLGSGVLPTVFMTPELAIKLPRILFPSSRGVLPGTCKIVVPSKPHPRSITSVSFDIPSKEMSEHTHRLTSTVLLTLARVLQTNVDSSFAPFNDSITTSPSLSLLLHYLAFGLSPHASTCNNIGIILATTSCSVRESEYSTEDVRLSSGRSLAEAYYQHGLALDAEDPHLQVNLGSLAKDGGDLPKAMHFYAQVLKKHPNFAVAHANMGNAIRDAGSAVEAIPYYRRAAMLNPTMPEAVCGLTSALSAICDWRGLGGAGRFARASCDAELLDNTLGKEGWLDKVIKICDNQIRAEYTRNVGVLLSGGTTDRWLDRVRDAYGDDPPEDVLRRWRCAIDAFIRPSSPSSPSKRQLNEGSFIIQLIGELVCITQHRWYKDRLRYGTVTADDISTEALKNYPRPPFPGTVRGPAQLSVLPFNTFTYPLPPHMSRIIAHRQGIGACYDTATSSWLPSHVFPPPHPPRDNQLRIGFISSDFNNHPLSHLMQSTFEYLKHKAFCYATSDSDGSQFRDRIEGAHGFVTVSRWSTKEIIERILADGIHILINLNGYTKGARNEVFAARPCPIQVAALGYDQVPQLRRQRHVILTYIQASTGWIDYLLCDSQTCPPHTRETDLDSNRFVGVLPDTESPRDDWTYTEKMIYMPHTYFVTDHKQSCRDPEVPEIYSYTPAEELESIWKQEVQRRMRLRKEIFPELPEQAVIFANFNQAYKICPGVFAVWLRILRKIPGSILWLLRFPAAAEEHLTRTALEWAGPEVSARIIFTDVAKKEDHIRRCCVADMSLDTLECNAHTVAADVLWSGTPLITWPKDPTKMSSRVASSLIIATGFSEKLIVNNLEEYEDRAVTLATSLNPTAPNSGELMEIRRNLFLTRDRMPLFDTKRWVKNFEQGLEEAWKRWETGTDRKDAGCIWVTDEDSW
ncbi:hypothetical protein FRB97_004687 [Tulasnella sp. 331]|nr:hypothetical protein FRB97_004687 [Tulasnella sp. 331]